jgi:hypothetical protein
MGEFRNVCPGMLDDRVIREHLWAKEVISRFIHDILRVNSVEGYDKQMVNEANADALIARLAQHTPPLLIGAVYEDSK